MFKDITLPPLLVMKYWVNNDLVDFDVEKICGAVGYYFHLDSRQVHSRGYRHVERCFLQVEVTQAQEVAILPPTYFEFECGPDVFGQFFLSSV